MLQLVSGVGSAPPLAVAAIILIRKIMFSPCACDSLIPALRWEQKCLATNHNKETQQVWDFAGDGFVHRLIHNKADGKLVEVSDPGQTSEERPQMPARLSDIQV